MVFLRKFDFFFWVVNVWGAHLIVHLVHHLSMFEILALKLQMRYELLPRRYRNWERLNAPEAIIPLLELFLTFLDKTDTLQMLFRQLFSKVTSLRCHALVLVALSLHPGGGCQLVESVDQVGQRGEGWG
jgi:hypothetical protein